MIMMATTSKAELTMSAMVTIQRKLQRRFFSDAATVFRRMYPIGLRGAAINFEAEVCSCGKCKPCARPYQKFVLLLQ